MTLPSWLRPWWRFFKRIHRLLSRASGYPYRAVSPLLGARGVPRTATATASETSAREPEAVTLHPGAPALELERTSTDGDPAGHRVFDEARSVTVPATFLLDIRGGRLSGDYGAAITPAGVLDHETSTYFGVEDWREHPIFLRPSLGDIEHVPGTVLSLTTRGTSTNYYHFLYDAIGRLLSVEQCLPGVQPDAVVVSHATRYQRELLELAGVTARLIQPQRGRTVSADRLLVPSNPNAALQAPPAVVTWLRERLPARNVPDLPRRLYLTRGALPRTRRYVEEAELWPHLEQRGFLRLDPGSLTVQEQIDVFAQAEVIVAPHGAALTNVTFSPPGVRVLEMFAATYVHLGLWSICQALGAEYRYLVADHHGRPGRANAGVLDDVSVPVPRVLEALDELLG
ncbi:MULTISPECIES: glycosyltransferase family 61 protein [Nocardioides]|uniref:Glycosyltransferase family 61 protein n=1 Tax=Nocardioides vastitatis TaxID=2568655 RepID=A0ABW0ZFZ7_9ACTN|nr:glycosyltransferase family 61 protein [Nocardioides sp.]THJ02331.1 glycosyltransferase family 61 protein [Nocardioides sp.]